MEAQSSMETDPSSSIKEMKTRYEFRIDSLHTTQLDLIASLQTLVPNVVSSLDLSLKSIFTFNSPTSNYTPLSQILPSNPTFSKSHQIPKLTPSSLPNDNSTLAPNNTEKAALIEESGGSLSVVRSIVASCLMERIPFTPIDSSTVVRKLENDANATVVEKEALRELGGELGAINAVEMALKSIGEDNGGVELEEFVVSGKSKVMVMSIDRTRLLREFPETKMEQDSVRNNDSVRKSDVWNGGHMGRGMVPRGVVGTPLHRQIGMGMGTGGFQIVGGGNVMVMKPRTEEEDMKDCEVLVNKMSYKEMKMTKMGEELLDLIQRPTARETWIAEKFKSRGGSQVKEYCTALTKEDCRRQSSSYMACEKVHFRRIIAGHTDMNLGDCSFLDTCRHMKTCKYVHYELDSTPDMSPMMMGQTTLNPAKSLKPQNAHYCSEAELGASQWINCDIRSFRMDILGQFGVIMADPPWDIHMELPYGTMADDEMRTLNVPALQTDGLIFLWVTGRAMELGRECLELWGYKRVEEIIWVKTNQLQRIIRTGRTGHWLNHSKEHCLVGVKGNPEVNRNIDTDVIVAEVRETSRKPDEMYAMLERISPRTRKLELFARMHNCQSGWLSMGNQLPGVRLVDEGLRARFKAAYPDVEVQPTSPPRTVAPMDVDQPAPPPSRNPSVEGSPHFTEPAGQAAAPSALEPNATNADVDMTN